MIKTLGEMLESLRKVLADSLDASEIKHAPTIGAMYEGLTAEILDRAIPPGPDLKVVSGFAVDGKGGTTGQLDCMLVRGAGSPVPFVPGMYQWHVQDVLAVFEVKKNLFGVDLGEAYDQLKSVTEISSSWLQEASGPANFSLAASMRAYAACTGEIAPEPSSWATMDPAKHLILHTIMIDQIAPVRIMLGYFGYSTEGGLRRGFADLIGKNLNAVGYGPPTLPNLMVANGVSLVKLSGHPYHHPVMKDGYWPILASSHVNPTLLILEAIWTRISYSHPISELFGEDLELERLSPFLEARPMIATTPGEKSGWMYRTTPMTSKQLADGGDHIEWQPVVLDDEQFVVVDRLCREDVLMDDPDLLGFLAKAGRQPDGFFQSLVDTNLVARDGNRLILTTIECATVILPDGRSIAAENNTGRLTRWLGRFMERRAATTES
ncbi:DUF6602 domain-containing protein [Sphingomonas koreensis]